MDIKPITLALTAFLLSTSVGAATLIDTTLSWDGTQIFQPFGESNTATYGQTFIVGADTQLDNFTFFMNDNLNTDTVDFEAFVMAWDGVKATGSILFQSEPMTTTNNNGSDGFEAFAIDTGGVNLVAGNQYVAFFSSSNLFDGEIGTATWATIYEDVYAGGSFVYLNNGAQFDDVTSVNWDVITYSDSSFSMYFTSRIPVPAAVWLFGSGLLGLIGVARRKKS